MEEDIFIIEENTQVSSKIELDTVISVNHRIDFDFCAENTINILTQNQWGKFQCHLKKFQMKFI